MERIIRKNNEFTTNKWSGGETTELFIYPENSSYKNRDFSFRISQATITDESSTFTALPGVERNLLVLDGKLQLQHNGKIGKWLERNNQEKFLGDWDTVSKGKATDFNLMTQGTASGTVTPVELLKDDQENYAMYIGDAEKCFMMLYVLEGHIIIFDGYEKKKVKEKELMIFKISKNTEINGFSIKNSCNKKSRFIKTEVYL